MQENRLTCVYFPEVDRFLVTSEGKRGDLKDLVNSDWYSSWEYFRYLPDAGISLKDIDRLLASSPHELCCEVTNDCNLSCPICIADSPAREPTQMPPDLFAKILNRMPDTVNRITLTGGEPTLHPGLPEMVRQITDTCSSTVLSTNGFLPTQLEEAVRDSFNVIVAISLHGAKEAHNAFAGCQDAYERTMESIRVAVTYATALQIHTTMTPRTLQGLPELCAILAELQISEHRLNLVKPLGRQIDSDVPYEDVVRCVRGIRPPYKIAIKRTDQPFLFSNCSGIEEIRHVRKC